MKKIVELFKKKKVKNEELNGDSVSFELNEVGYAYQEDLGIKFSLEGKYCCIKDVEGKGYCLSFNIMAKEVVYMPEGCKDVLGYSKNLFNIKVGRFDGELYSFSGNGIIVGDISDSEGKEVVIDYNAGYDAIISMSEDEDIDYGVIEFVEWNENSKIIKFSVFVDHGTWDCIKGKIKLEEEK